MEAMYVPQNNILLKSYTDILLKPKNRPLDKCGDLSHPPDGKTKKNPVFQTLTPHSGVEKIGNEEIFVGVSAMKDTFEYLWAAVHLAFFSLILE